MRDDVEIMRWSRIICGPLQIETFVTFPAPVQKQSQDRQGDRVQPPSVILQTDPGNLCFCFVFRSQGLRMQYTVRYVQCSSEIRDIKVCSEAFPCYLIVFMAIKVLNLRLHFCVSYSLHYNLWEQKIYQNKFNQNSVYII